tara:strand:- start:34 stop:228 length:195 start_codon:yes stop_codon:yes gene_type:complete
MRALNTIAALITTLITTVLIVTSPAIICWAAYQIDPTFAGYGLIVGFFFGPIGMIYLSAKLWSW